MQEYKRTWVKLSPEIESRAELDPWPKFLGFHISGLGTHPYMPNKETVMIQGRERRFITLTMGRGKVSTSTHL
jgi:hypothetical protein